MPKIKRSSKTTQTRIKLFEEFGEAQTDGIISTFDIPALNKKKCGKFVVYKPIIDGMQFDSALEARYYIYLLRMQHEGVIKSFDRQHPFELQPKFKLGKKWIKEIKYIADFVVTYPDNTNVVIDVKGRETAEFKIKKKMFEYLFGSPLHCVQFYEGQWMTLEDIKKAKRKKS